MERALDTASLRRLIELIVDELNQASGPIRIAAHAPVMASSTSAARIAHADAAVDAGATRLGLHASGSPAGNVAALIDHTLLKPDATQTDIETTLPHAGGRRIPGSPRSGRPNLGVLGGPGR